MTLLTGYWPRPELTSEETFVWGRQLAECEDVAVATQVIDALALSGRESRPSAGRFMADYLGRIPRGQPGKPEFPEIEAAPDDRSPEEHRAAIRACAREGRGPLVADLRETVEGVS